MIRKHAPARKLPAMHAVMKLTKINPCLMASLFGLMASVHRNTKEYMDASNSDCMPPSSAIAGSAHEEKAVKAQQQQ
jgi:hypothetical protein